ncbi:MAG: c-type cytochrome [Planctomycetota bacterium]|jgi:mono/diheme cytochrome c family protein
MRAILPLLLVCCALAFGADDAAVKRGKALFEDTQDLEYPSCAQCHSLLPEKEELKKSKHLGPGATLYGAVVRAGWRNMNTYKDVGEATQACAKNWQKRKQGLKAAQRTDLIAFLKQYGPGKPLPKRKITRPKLPKSFDGGDAAKGKRLTERYCIGCHNDTDESISFPFRAGRKTKAAIVRAVRGYNSKRKFKPKTMSYYTAERLSDEQLLHIAAYLGK